MANRIVFGKPPKDVHLMPVPPSKQIIALIMRAMAKRFQDK